MQVPSPPLTARNRLARRTTSSLGGWLPSGRVPNALHGRVVRFWHGDSVLEITDVTGHRRTLARVPRNLTPRHEELLSNYLVDLAEA